MPKSDTHPTTKAAERKAQAADADAKAKADAEAKEAAKRQKAAEEFDAKREQAKRDKESAAKAKELEIRAGEKSLWHVTGPGSVGYMGQLHGPGALLWMTEREARSLGNAIAPGEPKVANNDPSGGGAFRITAFGAIKLKGRIYPPGSVVTLSEDQAREFADRIERA